MSESAHFMQWLKSYDITWQTPGGVEHNLIVVQDDVQVVIRAIHRTDPDAGITVTPHASVVSQEMK